MTHELSEVECVRTGHNPTERAEEGHRLQRHAEEWLPGASQAMKECLYSTVFCGDCGRGLSCLAAARPWEVDCLVQRQKWLLEPRPSTLSS